MSDLPLAERERMLSVLVATLATLPADRAQTWRLGEAMRRMLRADGVAITVEYLSDSRTTICASDKTADAIESLQEIAGQGPGYEAARTDTIVWADLDGHADPRWPMLTYAIEERYRALHVCAVPVHAGGYLSGVATLYTRSRKRLTELPGRFAFLANAVGAALLADAADQPDERAHLGEAWSSRRIVHQATGMVMAQVHLTPEDALALLRAHAYATSSEISDVAEQVVSRSISFSNFAVAGD